MVWETAAIMAGTSLLGSLLGDNGGGTDSTGTQTIVNELPGYLRGPTAAVAHDAARLVGSDPYVPYQGQRIAGFTPDTQRGFDVARGASGIGALRVGQGYDVAQQAAAPIGGQDINRLFNPYLGLVGQQAERELSRQNLQQRNVDAARAGQAGAFGGARHGIVDTERERNFTRNLGDLWERTYAGGFDRALGGAQTDKARALGGGQAMGGIGAQGQNVAFADAAQQMGIGSLQQGQGQRNLDLAYGDFMTQRRYPYEQLGWLTGILGGSPGTRAMTQSSTGTAPRTAPSGLQQGLGAGLSTLGALGQLGYSPFGSPQTPPGSFNQNAVSLGRAGSASGAPAWHGVGSLY